jgi:hypothetical protein
MFTPPFARNKPSEGAPDKPASPASSGSDMDELRRQLDEMQKRLDRMGGKE